MATRVPELLPISAAARELRFSVEWLRQLADAGRVPCIRDAGGRRLFDSTVIGRIARERLGEGKTEER